MEATRFELISELPYSVDAVWSFHMIPEALEQLSPWWMKLKIIDSDAGVADGSLVRARVGSWPLGFSWHALHSGVRERRSFTDVALRSPFRYWVHQHIFEPVSGERTRLRDVIWLVPPAWLPRRIGGPFLRLLLSILFRWRHRKTRQELARSADGAGRGPTSSDPVGQKGT